MDTMGLFGLDGKVCVITGGAGLLGVSHAEAIMDAGGLPIILDNDAMAIKHAMDELFAHGFDSYRYGAVVADVTSEDSLLESREYVNKEFGPIHALINNAASNPRVEGSSAIASARLEDFPVELWDRDMAVGVRGAFLCAKVFGSPMAERGVVSSSPRQSAGVILNVSSDLGLIAPDQRIYEGSVKPVSYSVAKHALIGLTRYLATYWADRGVRCNAICPGGIRVNQDEAFVKRLSSLVPLGRMASRDEYKAAVVFLLSEASAYMTGSVVVMDGGRTCW